MIREELLAEDERRRQPPCLPATPSPSNKDDFESWAARCITIKRKDGTVGPFILNRPQRKLLAALEGQRKAGKPIRVILLKARQWGGSTLVQIYMAWIQLVHRTNWNSLTCCHVKDAARTLQAMLQRAVDNYPPDEFDSVEEGVDKPVLAPFQRMQNTRVLRGRQCTVAVGSAENQDASRGSDLALVHLSETAFWRKSAQHNPDDLVRAIVSGVALAPYTMIVMESTANGAGDYFHDEWLRAVDGRSDKVPVFVAWHECEGYTLDAGDGDARWDLWQRLTDYERTVLWGELGLDLDRICWYHEKALSYASHVQMMAEYPSTALEAFTNTGNNVFRPEWIEVQRPNIQSPAKASLSSGGPMPFEYDQWREPQPGASYLVTVDVGGRASTSDFSVVGIMRVPSQSLSDLMECRCQGGGAPRPVIPEVVAQWRGHEDHDRLADRAMTLARHYNNALLAVESNTLESRRPDDGSSSAVLERMRRSYWNLYMRPGTDERGMQRLGVHTNTSTKAQMITLLIAALRDATYIERSDEALRELAVYEQQPSGSYAARPGRHDDILMTRAIALFVINQRQL